MQTQSANTMSWHDALARYKLDFDIQKIPLQFRNQLGNIEQAPNLFGMQRTDNHQLLNGVAVGRTYEIIQTSSYADIGNRVTGGMNATFEKGGVTTNGKFVFLQAKLPDNIRVLGTNDVINKYITFINSFDGSSAFRVLINGVRLWCMNQLPFFRRDSKANGLSIRHTKSAHERLAQADKMVLEANNLFRGFEVKVNQLAAEKFTDAQMQLLSRRMFKVEDDVAAADIATKTTNKINQVRESFEAGLGINPQNRGTAWAAHNAITEFYNHHSSLRKSTDRFESNLIGSGANGMQRGVRELNRLIAEA